MQALNIAELRRQQRAARTLAAAPALLGRIESRRAIAAALLARTLAERGTDRTIVPGYQVWTEAGEIHVQPYAVQPADQMPAWPDLEGAADQ